MGRSKGIKGRSLRCIHKGKMERKREAIIISFRKGD